QVAILAKGVVQCYGSPAFLKKVYGTVYRCRLIRESPECKAAEVEALLQSCMPGAKLLSKVANEMIFSLGTKKLANFGHTFRVLRDRSLELAIADVGFPCLTTEDVLLRVSLMSGESLVPPSGIVYDPKLSIKAHLTRSASGSTCRGFVTILRYRARHYLGYSWFYLVLLASGVFLFLVFSDRVASVRLPLPRNAAPVRMDRQDDFKQGFYRAVDATAELEKALKIRAVKQGIVLDKTDSAEDRSYYSDDTTNFGIELGTQSLAAWYNIHVRQSEVLSLLLLQNAALQRLTASTNYSENFEIQAWREFTSNGATIGPANVFSWLSDVELKIVGAAFVPLSMGLFTAAAAIFPARDLEEGGRMLQQLSGLSGPLYWFANMFWDYGLVYHLYLVLLAPMVVIWGYGDSNLQFWLTVVLLFLAYGWAAIPFSYLVSKLFRRPSRAFAAAATIKGPIAILMVLFMLMLHKAYYEQAENAPSRNLMEVGMTLARSIPTVALSWGLTRAMWLTSLNDICHLENDADFIQQVCRILNGSDSRVRVTRRYWFLVRCCNQRLACMQEGPCHWPYTYLLGWSPNSLWPEIICMFLMGMMCLAAVCLAETDFWKIVSRVFYSKPHLYVSRTPSCLLSPEQKDKLTRHLPSKTLCCEDTLHVSHLRQEVGPYAPLHDITLCVHRREVLAVLAPTGSGKSLLLEVLAGRHLITDGNAYLVGTNLFTHSSQFVRLLGYMPQELRKLSWMTGRQLLVHMARMRRIPDATLPGVVNQLIHMLDLFDDADKPVRHFSSGALRKLSMSLAVVGAPQVLLLDNPSQHLDPVSRKRLWHTIITFVKKTHASVLLTTDDIQEAEAIATRTLFLHRGRMRPSSLYATPHGEIGYELTLSLAGLQGMTAAAEQEMEDEMQMLFRGQDIVVSRLQTHVRFRVMDDGVDWEQIIESMEQLRRQLGVVEYHVRVTTTLQHAYYRCLLSLPTPAPSLAKSPYNVLSPPSVLPVSPVPNVYYPGPPRAAVP
ncbi:unnamed protein product, partial [Ixodes hexagonus]